MLAMVVSMTDTGGALLAAGIKGALMMTTFNGCANPLCSSCAWSKRGCIALLSQDPDQPPQYTHWMPRNGQNYFLVLGNGTVQRLQWHGTDFDQEAWSFGNCFRSRREAERAQEGIREYLANFHREL